MSTTEYRKEEIKYVCNIIFDSTINRKLKSSRDSIETNNKNLTKATMTVSTHHPAAGDGMVNN